MYESEEYLSENNDKAVGTGSLMNTITWQHLLGITTMKGNDLIIGK